MRSTSRTALLVILCLCSLRKYGCCRVMVTTTPGEDDMDLERQLQSLNKPPVKTIQRGGDVIDCIDIYSQPALDNPLLKNHKIQLRPTSFPAETKKLAPMSDPISETWSRMEACPKGTVPIPRTTKDDLIRAKSLSHQMFRNAGKTKALAPNTDTQQVFVRINQKAGVAYYGVAGICSIYKLPSSPDWSSTSNVWVEGAPLGNYNVLIAGAMVSQPINGDDIPRLFVYWADGDKTGCFDLLCQGFVQTDRTAGPKTSLEPVSKFGGDTYDVGLSIYQDPISGNWWLQIGAKSNITVGYWPKEVVPGLVNGAEDAGWGGIAMAKENEDSPPMGSGQFPDGFYDHAAYFREVRYMLKSLEQIIPSDSDSVTEHVDGTGCYALQNDKDTWLEGWRYRFLFGGPGGNCGN